MMLRTRGLGQATNGAAVIAATIQKVEGYSGPSTQYPNGTLAYQNNNPGNLIYVGQAGATQGPPMPGTQYYYATFPSYQDGYNALLNQINTYGSQGLTINQMMAKYAPATDANGNPTGNNPTAYANQIASSLGVSPDTTVASAISGNNTTPGVSTVSVDPNTGIVTDDGSDDTSDSTLFGLDPTTALVASAAILAAIYLA
jgi:hypothetical protein